jgi:Ca2+-binding EF-hand superfamily protein
MTSTFLTAVSIAPEPMRLGSNDVGFSSLLQLLQKFDVDNAGFLGPEQFAPLESFLTGMHASDCQCGTFLLCLPEFQPCDCLHVLIMRCVGQMGADVHPTHAFVWFDVDNDRQLSLTECMHMLRELKVPGHEDDDLAELGVWAKRLLQKHGKQGVIADVACFANVWYELYPSAAAQHTSVEDQLDHAPVPADAMRDKWFAHFDGNKRGFLEHGEVRRLMLSAGYTVDDDYIQQLFAKIAPAGKMSSVDFDMLWKFIGSPSRDPGDAQAPSVSDATSVVEREIFGRFDKDGSGQLDKDELQALMVELGFACDDAYLTAMMKKFDRDGNSKICLEEFHDLHAFIDPAAAEPATQPDDTA